MGDAKLRRRGPGDLRRRPLSGLPRASNLVAGDTDGGELRHRAWAPTRAFRPRGGRVSERSDQPNVITLTGRFVIGAWIVPEKLQTSSVTWLSLGTRCP